MDLMSLRRSLMMQKKGLLPAAYQQVEWISSTNDGGQYINTLVASSDSIKVECGFDCGSGYTYSTIFGSTAATFFLQKGNSTNKLTARIKFGTAFNVEVPTLNAYIEASLSADSLVVNGTDYTPNVGTTKYEGNICLFGRLNYSSQLDIKGAVKIWYCKIYDNNALVRNFIPCIRIADSEAGMYDTVTKTFYTNDGTGEFTVPS